MIKRSGFSRTPAYRDGAQKEMYQLAGGYDSEKYGASADSAMWVRMSMLMNVGYIRDAMMDITPRQPTDRYYDFNWEDVLGMARVHRLGLDLLYRRNPAGIFTGMRNCGRTQLIVIS